MSSLERKFLEIAVSDTWGGPFVPLGELKSGAYKGVRALRLRRSGGFLQSSDGDLLEEDHVVVALILQADETEVGGRAALRFEIEFAIGHGVAVFVVGDLDPVQDHNRPRAVESYVHGVPFGTGLPG